MDVRGPWQIAATPIRTPSPACDTNAEDEDASVEASERAIGEAFGAVNCPAGEDEDASLESREESNCNDGVEDDSGSVSSPTK